MPSVDPSSTTTISTSQSSAIAASAVRMAAMVAAMPAASSRAGTITDARSTPGAGGHATFSSNERRTALSSTARYSTKRTVAAAASATALAPTSAGVDEKPWAANTPRRTITSIRAAMAATTTKAVGICTQRTNGSDRNVMARCRP